MNNDEIGKQNNEGGMKTDKTQSINIIPQSRKALKIIKIFASLAALKALLLCHVAPFGISLSLTFLDSEMLCITLTTLFGIFASNISEYLTLGTSSFATPVHVKLDSWESGWELQISQFRSSYEFL